MTRPAALCTKEEILEQPAASPHHVMQDVDRERPVEPSAGETFGIRRASK